MRLRAGFGFPSSGVALTTAGSFSTLVGLRGRRVFDSAAGSASALALPSRSPAAAARVVRRRRAGFVRFSSSSGAERLGGGASTAGGAGSLTLAIAREGSGGAVSPVG
ncbi:MAG: hypothetical protein WAL67_05480, partial [Candidatus Cybelea sp.]